MRRIACVALMVIVLSSAGHPDAAGADVIWAGGSHKMSNNSNPCSFVDAFILLHRLDDMALFTQPALTLKGGEIGFDLGFGGRSPLMNGEIVGGWNLFVDYTSDNSHKRLGTGVEVFHPNLSGHMNLYLPLSDEKGGEEALAGIDVTLGIPVPNAPFVSVWPGVYYYAGKDAEDKGGVSMALRVQPIRPVVLTLGGRNDALQAGRDESELFVRLDFTVPFDRLGKDLFSAYRPEYPLDVRGLMDTRVVREEFITIEHKRR